MHRDAIKSSQDSFTNQELTSMCQATRAHGAGRGEFPLIIAQKAISDTSSALNDRRKKLKRQHFVRPTQTDIDPSITSIQFRLIVG